MKNNAKKLRFKLIKASGEATEYSFNEQEKAIICAKRVKVKVIDSYTKKQIADFTSLEIARVCV